MTLRGRSVVVTRPEAQARELVARLEAEGARVHCVPTIVVVPALDAAAHAALSQLFLYDALLFTSANAVGIVHQVLAQEGREAQLGDALVFVIGEATARAVASRTGAAPIVAQESVSEGLAAIVRAQLGELAGKRLLLPRGKESRQVVERELTAAGARVDVAVVYETRPVVGGPELPEEPDWVTFASPSAVRAFARRFGAGRGRAMIRVACIGPVTADEARAQGWNVAAVATRADTDALVAAMLAAEDA